MLFNSFQFAVFFPCVAAGYFLLPARWRWAWMLAASYAFYMAWEPGYVVLLWASTLVDYVAGLRIAAADSVARRRRWLAASLACNLGLLFFFKYYDFFRDSAEALLALANLPLPLPRSPWLLPVGISFYTFQTLSYTLEVYAGRQAAERHLGRFALYVAFFPQLVAGPIERPQTLLPQMGAFAGFDYDRVVNGLRRMLWGFLKKVVIADNLAIAVDVVYGDPGAHTGPALAVATVFFAFQIYCDFSGYTDIALGLAQIFGVQLMENFRQPYFAASLREFWGRWHISLSTWFRDYVYIPLGGSRGTAVRWAMAVLVVFLVSGLWHGARWTFVVWGALHGAGMLAERSLAPKVMLPRPLKIAATFVVVCAAWVFFRAHTLADAAAVFAGLGRGWGSLAEVGLPAQIGLDPYAFGVCAAGIATVLGGDGLAARGFSAARFAAWPAAARWTAYSVALWIIFLFGVLRQEAFLYFQF
ncbi:MAG: MBOAT family protein [Candidatus Hydrogenedens sp.]|nr:MBOAT family protein [Candidatus Hydrogenedens sp.]